MKTLSSIAIITTIFIIACQNPSSAKVEANSNVPVPVTYVDTSASRVTTPVKEDTIVKGVLQAYLELKNNLVADKSKEASTAGKRLVTELKNFNVSSLPIDQQTEVKEILADGIEHAEHIGENADNIKHQREHFEALSVDMYDLIKIAGTSQTVYKDYCPMVKASWISEKKEIANPYYGKKMLTCGNIEETIEK